MDGWWTEFWSWPLFFRVLFWMWVVFSVSCLGIGALFLIDDVRLWFKRRN